MRALKYRGSGVLSVSLLFLVIMALCVSAGESAAAEYPSRAITIVVPYAAGGVTDLGARALAEAMEKHLKQPVVVVNKPGGGTTIGGNAVATARPDGYTLGCLTLTASVPEEFKYFFEAPYSSKDLIPICRVVEPVLVITVKEDSPLKTLKDMVAFARSNPGMKVANNGKGTLGYNTVMAIGKMEKVSFIGVPFAGDAQIMPAILGGHVPVGIHGYPGAKSLIDAKKLRALAVTTEKRVDFAPDIPSVTESGYKRPYADYNALFGPKGLPDEIVKKINETVGKIAQEEGYKKKIFNMGFQVYYEPTPSFQKSVQHYKETLRTLFKEEGMTR